MDYKTILDAAGLVLAIGGSAAAIYAATKLNSNKIAALEKSQKDMKAEINEKIDKIEERHERHEERLRKSEQQMTRIFEKVNAIDSKAELLVNHLAK